MTLPSRRWWQHYFRALALIAVPLAALLTIGITAGPSPGPTEPAKPEPAYTFADDSNKPFPGNRFVALYGAPDEPVLGALGAQGPQEAVERVKRIAAEYQPYSEKKIMPAFEIIATVAAAEPTANNDYSREHDVKDLRPWVDIARQAGVYVILDLQPGSTDFEVQAKQYEELLRQPHVGLALDPEWRMQPGKKHLEDIGSVSAEEVNRTAAWLGRLTRDHHLPQKVFLLHQFRMSMLPDRQTWSFPSEIAPVIQMDGQGATQLKQQTYAAITAEPPEGVRFGWKNFYAKDAPVLTPEQTMRQQPLPWLISYQ